VLIFIIQKFYVLCTECIYVFVKIPKQTAIVFLYNTD